ncbi:MAG: TIR domain-containing protein [Hyphomicrobiaceae bacterium]
MAERIPRPRSWLTSSAPGHTPAAKPDTEAVEWYLARNGQQHGPLTQAEMGKFDELGHLMLTDLVWRAGWPDWKVVSEAFTFDEPIKPPMTASQAPARPRGDAAASSALPDSIRRSRERLAGKQPMSAAAAPRQPVSPNAAPAPRPEPDTPDVFISYASPDRDLANSLSQGLRTRGYATWWAISLKPGEKFHEVIDQKVGDSKAVVVIWSPASRESDWVYAEADHGRRDGKLVNTHVEGLDPYRQIPKPFGTRHSTLVTDTDGIVAALDALKVPRSLHAG